MTADSTSRATIFDVIRSTWTWTAVAVLVLSWLPLLAVIRVFDRDPVRYRTGRWFRRLGVSMVAVNRSCRVRVSGFHVEDPRLPYVVVGNHQSLGDIPVFSLLPWEMKWLGKESLFKIPVVGWMMRLAGDISVDRADPGSGRAALARARKMLDQRCSIMIFPEGTRTPDGRMLPFHDGAFALAVWAQVPILPIVVDGTVACLPRDSWIFCGRHRIRLTILPPVGTAGSTMRDIPALKATVRGAMLACLAASRGVPVAEVDSAARVEPDAIPP